MTIPNLHDRRMLEKLIVGMDTEAIVRGIQEGGLSALARKPQQMNSLDASWPTMSTTD